MTTFKEKITALIEDELDRGAPPIAVSMALLSETMQLIARAAARHDIEHHESRPRLRRRPT